MNSPCGNFGTGAVWYTIAFKVSAFFWYKTGDRNCLSRTSGQAQLTRMTEPIPLPVNPPRTHSRLYHHPALRTDGRRRTWVVERRGRWFAHHFYAV